MSKSIIISIGFIIGIVLFAGCKKDDIPKTKRLKFVTYKYNGPLGKTQDTSDIFYYEDGMVSRIEHDYAIRFTQFFENGKLARIDYADGRSVEYRQKNNVVSAVDLTDKLTTDIYTLGDDGRVRAHARINPEGEVSNNTEYFYVDGNMLQEQVTYPEHLPLLLFEYDDKINPWYPANIYNNSWSYSVNNVTNLNGSRIKSYEYDDAGYVTTVYIDDDFTYYYHYE